MSIKRSSLAVLVVSLVVVVIGLRPQQAAAQASQRSYSIQHNFWVRPNNPVAPLGVAWWRDYEHAWAWQQGFPTNASWSPAVQNPGYNGTGFDWMDARGRVWNTGVAGRVPVNERNTLYVGPPWPFTRTNTVNAASGGAWATASASVSVNSWAPGGWFWGWHRASGTASCPAAWSVADAFSSSKLFLTALTWDWRTGQIRWQPLYNDTISGSAVAVGRPRPRDPINIRLFDDQDNLRVWPFSVEGIMKGAVGCGQVLWNMPVSEQAIAVSTRPARVLHKIWPHPNLLLEDTLLDIGMTVEKASGTASEATASWEYGRLKFSGVSDATFWVDMSDAVTSGRGTARLTTQNGVIVESYDDGIFDGLLPSLGMPGDFDIPFLYELNLNYYYGLGDKVEMDFGGGMVVPEPAALGLILAFGLLGLRRRD